MGHQDCGVASASQDLAYRRADVDSAQTGSCYLIEQWLEEMMIAAIDQRDSNRSPAQGFRRVETGKTSSDNHNMGMMRGHLGHNLAKVGKSGDRPSFAFGPKEGLSPHRTSNL